jgi:RNA polymerase sigma factor (sigma-70 family)
MGTTSFDPLNRYLRNLCPESDAAILARFARSGDEEAFAELVRRHGSAILGVCRRILRDGHAAEDAFQATFLLLAKKADSLRRPEQLGCWLHGVARRTALKLRGRLLRRLTRERPFDESAVVPSDPIDADLGPAVDAAIEQLPWKYRLPVVLCYLQGMTNAEAAVALGCPTNTVSTRLARARQRLRGRLAKQGLTVAVSSALVAATARNASALATGASPSLEILTLMEGVRSAMMWKKTKLVVATVLVLALSGVGAAQWGFRATAQQPVAGDVPQKPSEVGPVAVPPTAAIPQDTRASDRIPPVDLAAPDPKTKNFVVTGTTAPIAYEIAQAAEKLRADLAKQWLGKELPDWKTRCPINVTITEGAAASAATTFDFGPTASFRTAGATMAGISWKQFRISGMRLTGSKDQILADTLPHEVAHTVLADHFREPVPRWAEEGMAVMAETPQSQRHYDKQCRVLLNAGRAMRLKVLFERMDYPSDAMLAYAQGYSVVRFLVEQKDRPTLLAFISAGMLKGWDVAVKGTYGYESIDALEEAWITSLRQVPPTEPLAPAPAPVDPLVPAPTEPPGNVPPTPPSALVPTRPPELAPAVPPANDLAVMPPAAIPAATGFSVVQVSLDKEGMVVCKFAKTTYHEPVTNQQPGQKFPVTSFVRRTVQEEHMYRSEQLRIIGSDGKLVDAKELPKSLAKESTALFVSDGRDYTSLLPVLKDGTLIIAPAHVLGPPTADLPRPTEPQPGKP